MDRTTIMLPPDLKIRASNQAKKMGISLGKLIRDALEKSLKNRVGERDISSPHQIVKFVLLLREGVDIGLVEVHLRRIQGLEKSLQAQDPSEALSERAVPYWKTLGEEDETIRSQQVTLWYESYQNEVS